MKLPQELVEVAHKYGISGVVYIPVQKRKSQLLVKEAFAWFNYVYSIFGATYTEKKLKKNDRLIRNLRVSLLKVFTKKTVASIIKRAHDSWQKWYNSEELPIVKSIEDLSSFSQVPFINLYKFYLKCRTTLLLDNPVPEVKSNEYQQVYEKVRDLAQKSIKKLPQEALCINQYKTVPFVYHKKSDRSDKEVVSADV